MAKGDTKTNQYLDIAANGTRADLPTDTCCETRSQTLIREVAERIMDVEDEVEEIKNNPDVVDIVPTYAALQNYDTSSLTDKDIIRVLQDETHDGDSTYYRYNAQSGTWTYVGESKQYEDFVGTDGTAGGQNGLVPAPVATDAGKFLNANGSWEEVQAGGITELTTADYNWPTNNPTSVALWLLEPGVYTWNNGVNVQLNTDNRAKKGISIVSSPENDKVSILNIPAKDEVMWFSTVTQSNGQQTRQFSIEGAVDYLTDTSGTAPLAANQGRVLKSQIGNLANLTTTDKNNLVAAINEAAAGSGGGGVTELTSADYNYHSSGSTNDGVALWLLDAGVYVVPSSESLKIYYGTGYATESGVSSEVYIITPASGSMKAAILITPRYLETLVTLRYTNLTTGACTYELIPDVVQSTGVSTTTVMSQNAVTSMVFADPSTKQKVQIGANASASALYSIAIGSGTTNRGIESVVIGSSSYDYGETGNVVIGKSAGIPSGTHLSGAVALGYQSTPSRSGEVYIGSTNTSFGFNNTKYRVIGGVHAPQSAHDAATKGYVDPTTDSSAPTTATVGRLGQIQIDTTTATAYMCVAVDTVTPAYTWKQITA